MATTMTDYAAEREAMVERQLRRRGITEQHIVDAFLEVPREAFVSPDYADLAYGDHPLPIEAGQTISQPYIVALMIQAAGIGLRDKVLEVGAGSGYAAAVISRIAGKVIAIERQHELVEVARERLQRLGGLRDQLRQQVEAGVNHPSSPLRRLAARNALRRGPAGPACRHRSWSP